MTRPTFITQDCDFTVLAHHAEHTDKSDCCDPVETVYLLRLDRTHRAMTRQDIIWQLEDHAAPGGCSCSHDCCGHRFGSADARFAGDMQTVVLEVFSARNY